MIPSRSVSLEMWFFVVLFHMNFSRGEPVDCFTLGNIPQIGQIFFRNVKGITHSGGVPRRVPGVAIDTIKGVTKVEGIHPVKAEGPGNFIMIPSPNL